jgi:hypothetical protein
MSSKSDKTKTKTKAKTKGKKDKAPKSSRLKKKVETAALDHAPMLASDDEVLGSLSMSAAADEDAPKAKRSMRKDDRANERQDKEGPSSSDESADSGMSAPVEFGVEVDVKQEPLKLPRGAFLALRKSGGLNFTTREVVVYPDGRVAYDARGVPQKEYNRLRRVLNDAQVLGFRKLLDQSNFWKSESVGAQNPDA